jgi:Ca-activated chloride channel family protein
MGAWTSALDALARASWRDLGLEMPGLLLLALSLPALAILLWLPRGASLSFSRGQLAASLGKGAGHVARFFAVALMTLGAAVIVLAMAGPTAPGEPDRAKEEGIDIVVVLDVSGSMRAADFKPRDRLTVAKRVIRDHLLTRTNDRIGLVIFAGEAFTQSPLTRDRDLLAEILRGVRTGIIEDGTAIGDAIATGVNRLRDSEAKGRALILVTDGENNAGNLSPEEAAALAREFDIKVYPILVGKGGQVPFPTRSVLGGTSYTLRRVDVNPKLLKEVARVARGQFFTAENPHALETSFQEILERLEKTRLDAGETVRRPVPLYPLLLPLALLLLLLGLSLHMTRGSVLP